MVVLKPPMHVNFASNNVSENWRRFESQFRVCYITYTIGSKSTPTQVWIQLHTTGPEAQYVHETFTYTGEQQHNDIEAVLMTFPTYREPRKNIVFQCYQFWDRSHNKSEPINPWIKYHHSKAVKCGFGTFESDMIRDKVVFGVCGDRVKERLLRELYLTINKALYVCRTTETSKQHIEARG